MRKYTVITGVSSRIGIALAKELAMKNKNLLLVARHIHQLEELKSEILGQNKDLDIIIKPCDLLLLDNVYQLYKDLKNLSIETWVNNAELSHSKKIIEQDLDKVINMIRVNIEAVTILSTLYTRDYKDIEGSTLMNVPPTVGYDITKGNPTYSATKFYVSPLSKALYWELKEQNAKMRIKIIVLAPEKTEFLSV